MIDVSGVTGVIEWIKSLNTVLNFHIGKGHIDLVSSGPELAEMTRGLMRAVQSDHYHHFCETNVSTLKISGGER